MTPTLNGFSITTYSYDFPIDTKESSSGTDIITVTGA